MKIVLTTFVLLLTIKGFTQKNNFEGTVDYLLEVKNPNPKILPDSIWNSKVKKKSVLQRYLYKGNRYKSIMNNESVQIYNPNDNMLLNYKIGKDTVQIKSIFAGKTIDPILSIEEESTSERVLGYECKKIIIKGKLTETTYFFSNKIRISAKNFKNHYYGNWNKYLEVSNSLPLKIITRNNFLFMIMTATNIDFSKVDDSEFKI